MKHYKTISQSKADIEIGYKEPNQALIDAAERLKGKELFKESNDRAKKILSEIKSLPKQETLEEAAKENFKGEYICNGIDIVPAWREGFIIGAKWAQEKSYSEEEILPLLEILQKCKEYFLWKTDKYSEERADAIIDVIEQFKNK